MMDVPATETVEALFGWARYYGYAGVAVAAGFLLAGVGRIDPGARGSYLFRLLLIPATVAFWPVILWRWVGFEKGRTE